jgi:hypothetical protein
VTLTTRRFLAGLGAATLAGPAGAQRGDRPYRTEIVVRTVRNLHTRADVAALVEMAAANHVDVINVAAKQDEDDEVASGTVFFASTVAPRAHGWEQFDALHETVEAAHRRGVKVRAWVPQFHDQAAMRHRPAWQMHAAVEGKAVPFSGKKGKEYFVNPLDPEVQDYQRAIVVEIVRNYPVDGIVLDWLRFDDFNMDVGPGTRTRYRALTGVDPLAIDFASDNARRRAWNAWRAAALGDYVHGIRSLLDATRPGLELGFYILPPEFVEVAQDAATFAGAVNFLSPLAYFRDWGYEPRWVYRNVIPDTVAKAGRTHVIPVLDEDWTDAAYREIIPHLRRDFPSIDTLSWFVYGRWTEGVLRRIDLLRRW